MLPNAEILLEILHVLLIPPPLGAVPDGAHPVGFQDVGDAGLAADEMVEHLPVEEVPFEHVGSHVRLVSLPRGLREIFGNRWRFGRVGEKERWRRSGRRRRGKFMDGLIGRTRFEGERGVEVPEVSQPVVGRCQWSDVFQPFQVEVRILSM